MIETHKTMVFYKVCHEHELEWIEDNDVTTFVVVVAERETDCGTTTYLYSNTSSTKRVKAKISVLGHLAMTKIGQFELKIETGVTKLGSGMQLIGATALREFLKGNHARPITYGSLYDVLAGHDQQGYFDRLPSPL